MSHRKVLLPLTTTLVIVLLCSTAWSQRLDGTLRGTVQDPAKAVVSGAKVTITNQDTGVTQTVTTTSAGNFVFPNLIVGPYTVAVEAPSFQKYVRKDVQVLPNQIVTADAMMTVGSPGTTIEVTAGAETVQVNTSQLSNDFGERAVSDLPNPGLGGTPLNLSILAPNTTTQGAGVLGEGGSIGGARPRLNSFNIDGVDDNRVDVTGHTSEVIPEAVADFNLVTNMFTAEQSHSAGGQFNIITRSGTNNWHGSAWYFNNNRDFNAMDNLEKAAVDDASTNFGTSPRRVDRNRIGGMLGGPILKDKLFIFGAYQFNNIGLASSSVAQSAPTTAGLATLNSLAANDQVREILAQFPTANAALSTESVNGVAIPIGLIQASAPSYQNENTFNINGDLNAGNHQLRLRYLYDRLRSPNVNPVTPLSQFTGSLSANSQKAIVTDAWNISNTVINDLRLSYSRFVQDYTVPGAFSNFPNAEVDTLGLNVGPEGNSPQSYAQNNYQVLDAVSLVRGKHSLKFGAEYRRWIAPSNFLPRSRGEWDYSTLDELVNDTVPTGSNGALRGAGTGVFNGNQYALYGFVQDDWKVTPRLTLNLGIRYEWYSNPAGVSAQTLNTISDSDVVQFEDPVQNLPRSYIFRQPKTDTNNFMPRVGFAWDVTGDGKTALRGGFGISFDVTPQNFPLLQLPPQLQTEQNPDITCTLPAAPSWCSNFLAGGPGNGFLGGGGLLQVNVPPATKEDAQAATQGLILDFVQPKVLTWTLSAEREIMRDTSIELRYLGTRATALPVQARMNTQSAFDGGLSPLPTYFTASEVPATIAGGQRLADFENFSPFVDPAFSLMTSFPALGGSIYHAGSIDLNRRFSRGVLFRVNYTYSHNIDDATNELFSSLVNPRRPQDWRNMGQDRGNSTLDYPHKFTLAWVWDIPKLKSDNGLLKTVMNGWEWTGNYLIQSGQPVSILSDTDSNGNADAAGDRAIFNPAGTVRAGSGVDLVCVGAGGATSIHPALLGDGVTPGCASSSVAGYVASDPTAQYVQAQLGALSNVGRNSFRSPGVNIWNMGMFKNTNITERFTVQLRAMVQNIFNHRNFSLAQPTVLQTGTLIGTTNNALSSTYSNVDSGALFLNPKQFNGGSRIMELGLKLIF
jgi:hypothetical protein